MFAVEDGDGVGADDLMQGHLYGFEQVEVVAEHDMLDELHQHLGVGDALEGNAARHEVLLDGGVVLDDAVMDERQASGGGVMGMGVGAVGFAVGSPTGVGDASAAADVLVLAERFEVGHLAFGLIYVEVAAVSNHGHAGTVVASIF